MLNWMRIRNLALAEKADLEFGPGFNVISGETGAGKSVIMGAVGMLLGERADKSSIRNGESRCEISGEFSLDGICRKRVSAILEESGIAMEETLLVRRVLTHASCRNFVNESPVTLQVLRRIGEVMVDIHDAEGNLYLLKPQNQLEILDRFDRNSGALEQVQKVWEELSSLRKEQENFLASMPSAEETARYRRDASEIEKAAPQEGEDELLSAKHETASHSRSIIELAMNAAQELGSCEECVLDRLGQIRRTLTEMGRYESDGGAEFLNALEEASSRLAELSSDLEAHASEVDMDEEAFHAMEDRMQVLQTLKRRYGPEIHDVLEHLVSIQAKIDAFDNAEYKRQEFEKKESLLLKELREKCDVLRAVRKKCAEEVEKHIVQELKKLGFLKSEFSIAFGETEPGANGADKVEFLFSANPGVPKMPLREVASSGELSRVMLAVKTVLAEADEIPILIFDEIDANIGGATASKVGNEIRVLSNVKQILCISHLPQVASCAETHFLVAKHSENNVTKTSVTLLDREGRIGELTRMLGGGKGASELAETMLAQNRQEK